MYQIKEMTDEEQLQVYRDTLTFDQLALMHIELLKHIPEPEIIYQEFKGEGK
jgi:hypothetical protein